MSEQSREGEERVYTIWLCGECKAGPQEPTKGGWVCGECGASDRTNYLDQAKVVRREPAQPQPRGEVGTCDNDDCQRVTALSRRGLCPGCERDRSEPTREGDDLAARLDSDRLQEWFTELQASASLLPEDLEIIEAMIARTPTHPEQSARETNLRMNRWREHLGDDPLDGFGGRGPAEYHYMATHEPEGPGLTRFGNRGFRPAPPRGEGDDLAARLEARADNADKMAAEVARNPSNYGESGPRHHARLLAAAYAFRKAAEMARASTHPEQWVSGDDREWLLWITSYVLNRHEFTDSAATDARAALTRIATAIKQPASPTPTEQGEDRTRVEWHDGIEHGDELALRQLAADIGCGIPYGCQPSIGKWYAAALDRVLDRLLPLHPAPEQGEARVLREGEIADHADAGGRFLYDCPKHGLIEDGWVGSFRCEDDNEGDIMYCTLCPPSHEWAKDELKGPFAFPPAQTEQGEGDDLAARLDGDRLQEWFTEIQASASLLPEDLQIIEAMIARASTHPEQEDNQ